MGVDRSSVFHSTSPLDRGLYVFLMRMRSPAKIRIGTLGKFLFPDGWYIYTGHAKRDLHQRVERHWSDQQTLHRHIDYLTAENLILPIGAVLLTENHGSELDECWVNQRVGRMLAAETVVPGFGATECSHKCPAHLWFSFRPISLLEITPIFPHAALLLPQSAKSAHV